MLKKKGLVITISIIVAILLVTILGYVILKPNNVLNESNVSAELEKMRTYDRVQAGEENTNSEYVQFDGFFLCDLDGDGYADKVRGTCKEIGKEDTLYMELNVLTDGYLKDGKITINSDNFYFETAIVKDGEVSENYIGSNTKEIDLNKINNGTQKLLTGVVKSGDYSKNYKADAIDGDPAKYSRVNSVTLTGTHVIENEDGTTIETPISKTVNFNIDWYGEVDCTIPDYVYYNQKNKNQSLNINDCFNEEKQELNLNFNIITSENKNELILKKSYIEGTIPDMNGYAPISVSVAGTNVTYTYDENTRIFTAQREAVLNSEGKMSLCANSSSWSNYRYNEYSLNVVYPLAAYRESGVDTLELKIPIKAYYEGYNNVSSEFVNPYKSDIAQDIVTVSWSTLKGTTAVFRNYVGEYKYSPNNEYVISKEKPLKIYDGISENETNDYYIVKWVAFTGSTGESDGIIMKETADDVEKISDKFVKNDANEQSMKELTGNVGIYFSDPTNLLGANGWIKVYDDDTNKEIASFNKENWNNYSASNPYMYENKISHIRIETSATNRETNLIVYNIKELDDEYITENYSREEFDTLEYIKSTLVGYLKRDNGMNYINTDINQAHYEMPVSKVELDISPNAISTQEPQKNAKIKIKTVSNLYNEKKWINGIFLLKLPKEIINLEINDVKIDNADVKIVSYEKIENDGNIFVKVITNNEKEANYEIEIDCDIAPNPKNVTSLTSVELYSVNENCENYYYKAADIYDIDGDFNTQENVNYISTTFNLISPNSILTSQEARKFNDLNECVIAPQKAEISKEQRTAQIAINLTNNYSSTISDVKIIGKIPFEGNTYCVSGKETGSDFTTTLTEKGIILQDSLKDKAKVYYSTNENPTTDLKNESNGWTTEVNDFSKIKTYLIDFGDSVLQKNESHEFTYEVNVPEGLEYNQISYSVHAVYFSLDTENGKYKTKTEPTKLGIIISKKYNFSLTKYQKNTNKKISGAIYSLTEEGEKESKTIVTNENEGAVLKDLYVGKTYVLREIKTPNEYVLNDEVIKFKTILENDTLKLEVLEGNPKNIQTIKNDNDPYLLKVEVEDEVKANLNIVKTDTTTGDLIKNVKYKITGKGLGNGKIRTTNSNGAINLIGLYLNEKYVIEEVKATGYYLENPIEFIITEKDGKFNVSLSGKVKEYSILLNDEIPTLKLNLENEKIPTFNLNIIKKEKDKDNKLSGAQFKLEGEGINVPKIYTTDENGEISIEGLYQYVEGKNLGCEYTLTEVSAPDGYDIIQPIVFKAQKINDLLDLTIIEGNVKDLNVNENTISIIIEDKPLFNLIKKDAENGNLLPNAKFVIYEVDENKNTIDFAKDVNGNIVGDGIVTDEKGEISCGLRAGFYKAVEIEAPEGYELSENEEDRSYYFGIDKNQEAEYETEIEWSNREKIVSSYYNSGYRDIVKVEDGYIAASYAGKVVKYDLNGNYVWKNVEKDYHYKNIYIVDDAIIIVAYGGQIVKYDLNGNIIWENTEIKSDIRESIKINDGIIVSFRKEIIKYDFDGNIKWHENLSQYAQKIFYVNDFLIVFDSVDIIKYDLNGNIVLKVQEDTRSYTSYLCMDDGIITTSNKGVIAKYDFDGNIVWKNSEKNYYYSKCALVDDGIIAIGNWGKVVKYDFNGKFVWENTEKNYYYNDLKVINNGILAISPTQIVKYDFNGNYEWETSYYGGVYLVTDGIIFSDSYRYILKYDFSGNCEWKEKNPNGLLNNLFEYDNYIVTFRGERGKDSIIKYDFNGNVISYNTELGYDYVDIKLIENGVIAISRYGQVVRYDLDGNIVWENTEKEYNYKSVTSAEDGIIAVSNSGQVVKYDLDGNIVWENTEKRYGYTDITSVDDGVIAVSGYYSAIKGQVVKYDLNGNIVWENTEKNYAYQGATTVEDGIIAVSDSGQVVKYDLDGNIVWENTEKEYNYISVTTVEADVIVLGSYGEVVKYDLNGNLLWENNNTEKKYSYKRGIIVEDGIIIIGGSIIKKDFDGNIIWKSSKTNYCDVVGVDDGVIAICDDEEKGVVEKLVPNLVVPSINESTEIVVENDVKQFKITTDVKEYEETIDGETKTIKGGTISGEDEKPYEKVKYGKDSINEIKAIPDEGYKIISITVNDKDIDFIPDEDGSVTLDKFINMQEDKHVVVTFSNTRSNVKVHHYMATKNADKSYTYTNIKLADDENITGKIGDKYTTAPKVNLDKYTLIMDEDGEYILPDNCTGVFTNDTQDVNYYYYEKKVPLTVNYYIEGTTEKVPSINGDVVGSINSTGDAGSEYNTVSSPDVLQKYELVAIPVNANGILDFNEVVVNYYYRLKTENITTEVKAHDEIDELGIVKQVKGETISGENEMPYETVEFGENSTKEIVAKADKGYKIKSIQVQSINNDGIVTTEDVAVEENSVEFKLDLFENVVENKHVIVEFEKMKSRVLVHYYIEGTEDKVPTIDGVAEDVETEGNIGDIYATKEAENVIDRYELIQIPENASGEYTEDEIVVIYYYRAKDAHVNVHHYLEGTTEKVSDDVSIDGKVGDAYATTVATEIDEKYELVAEPNNKNGTMTEETIEVIYYYRVKDTKLIVKYIDKSTGDFMYKADGTQETEIVAIGKVGSEYSTNAKEYEGYTLVETTDNTSGILTIEPIEVIYYYLPQTRATVQYIDKITGNILDERTDNGLVGDLFETDSKDFDGYILVEEPKEKIVKMTKDEIVLKYYYIHISAGVIEKHIDIMDNSILANEVHKGNEGDEYNIPSRSFEGYDLVEDRLPTNNVGTMTVEPITVTYYYIHKAKVTVRYVDKITGKDLTEQIIQNGHEGDLYTTENKDFDGYELTEIPDNATGTMTRDTINIIYYYIHESAGVRVNHYDVMTNEKIAEEKIIKGKEGEEYTTSEENIVGYDLVKEKYPNNATGTMTVDEIIVNYYYIKKSNIIVRHVDKLTGKDIIDKEEIVGHEGDSYTTSSKQFIGYKLIEEPANKDGVMKKETIEVIYYYIRPAKVKVNYIDIDTGKEIEESIEIDGNEGDTYTTSEKDIKYYELVKEPENKNGKMTVEVVGDIVNNTIEVNYYYRKLDFNLKLDKIVDSVIINGKKTVVNGDLGKVEVPRKELASAKVQVIYRIRVINNSKIAGKAEVMEIIPEGMKMTAVDNAKWKINRTTATISTGNIEPGKYEDIGVVMSWDNKEDSIGNIENIAQITGTDNDAGFAQTDEKDDADSANVIVAVGTGETTYVVMTGVLLFILSGAALMIVAKREE